MAKVKEFGSEFDWQANTPFLQRSNDHLLLSQAKKFRSGRDAMKAVAITAKDRYRQVLLPALCCESMVSPFTLHGIKPVFYKMHPDYRANALDVKQKLTEDSILVYGSYFGVEPFDAETLSFLHRLFPHALFMEDRTQDILASRENSSFSPDFTIASIRKWIPIPDGGLLWGKLFTNAQVHPDFSQLRKEAMRKKSEYLQTGSNELKDTFRKMLGQASELLDQSAEPYAMTAESQQLLASLDFQQIYACRQANAKALMTSLSPDRAHLRFITNAPEISTLYFPILVKDQGFVQKELAKLGIYCPVIWPVPEEALGVCEVAQFTADHMLGVPCDQRYTPEDMAYIGKQIMRIAYE